MVFEIVSESETAVDTQRKIDLYLAHGAHEVWAVHPDLHKALVFGEAGVRQETQLIRSEFLPGVEIPLAAVL